MGLHGDVSIEVVQSAVCLLATVPSALVHALNLLVSSPRSLVLLRAWYGHKAVDLNMQCQYLGLEKYTRIFPSATGKPQDGNKFPADKGRRDDATRPTWLGLVEAVVGVCGKT